MRELPWFGKDRDKQKLMTKASHMATEAVENLRNSNFTYIDAEGSTRIKKEFTWNEFAPQKNNNPQLSKPEVLEALGVSSNLEVEDAPERDDIPGRELKGIWSTIIPVLNYILTKQVDSGTTYGYFQVQEARPQKSNSNQPMAYGESAESLNDWNKRVWSQEEADQKANKEIMEDPANYSKDRND